MKSPNAYSKCVLLRIVADILENLLKDYQPVEVDSLELAEEDILELIVDDILELAEEYKLQRQGTATEHHTDQGSLDQELQLVVGLLRSSGGS